MKHQALLKMPSTDLNYPNLSKMKSPSLFSEKVYSITKKIPKGKTLSYNSIALKLRSSPRAVAQALKRNPYKDVPCHRVINSNGLIGGYRGVLNSQSKARKLKREGVIITLDKKSRFLKV